MTTYGNVLRSLLPPGPAWSAETGSELMNLLDALGDSLAVVDARALALLEEFDPRTTTELLADWERVFGLPGTNPTPPATVAGRRLALWTRMLGYGDPAPAFFETLAATLGYLAIVTYARYPVHVSGSPCGAILYDRRWAFLWTMHRLAGALDASLTWLAGTVTPAHTQLQLTVPTWREITIALDIVLNGVAYGAGVWVIVGIAGGADAYILSSVDGEHWLERTNPKNTTLYAAAFGDGLFVAVGDDDGGGDAYLITSPDGSVWTERATPRTNALMGVHYANGLWVAVGLNGGGDAYIITSINGIAWTERVNPKNFTLRGIVYGNGLWVAVGFADGVDAYIVTSPDGIVWTERSNPKNKHLTAVTFGDGLFVAVGMDDGVDAYLITSPDGINWTERSNPKNTLLYSVTYYDGIWMATGGPDGGGDAYLLISRDAITWTEWPTPQNRELYGILRTRRLTVAVGESDGVNPYLLIM